MATGARAGTPSSTGTGMRIAQASPGGGAVATKPGEGTGVAWQCTSQRLSPPSDVSAPGARCPSQGAIGVDAIGVEDSLRVHAYAAAAVWPTVNTSDATNARRRRERRWVTLRVCTGPAAGRHRRTCPG